MNRFIAIPVKQPIGEFFLCSIPYEILEKVAIPDVLTLAETGSYLPGYYRLEGNQREELIGRRKEIGNYINSVEATFPNTIILAANRKSNGEALEDDAEERWYLESDEDCGVFKLVIPSTAKVAKIIDGQHRVRGFRYSNQPAEFELPCAVFLDLSMPEQARIFATININQRKVDRSLAFNLFAYNLDDEPASAWTPDKLAVFLTRKLSIEDDSPLRGHIKVIARQGKNVYKQDDWHVSTSVFVDGIAKLFSSNVARDRDAINAVEADDRERKKILASFPDKSPYRGFYLETNDLVIYTAILNYFKAVQELLFGNLEKRGFLTKSIGIQALLEFLRDISYKQLEEKNISQAAFEQYLLPVQDVDFTTDRIAANAQGKQRIRNLLLYANHLEIRNLKDEDKEFFEEMLAAK